MSRAKVPVEPPAAPGLRLFSYWRSSAAYRVRLALAWKGLDAEIVPVDLRAGRQGEPAYRHLNPQGLLPLLDDGGIALAQSLAIIEYLDETRPLPPLLPADAIGRARVRAAAQIVAADIHPINNLRVLRYLKDPLGHDQATIDAWVRHWIESGLSALEAFAVQFGGACLYGDTLTLADLCLVPQLYNARRVAAEVARFPRLTAIEAAILTNQSLAAAAPERQPDAA